MRQMVESLTCDKCKNYYEDKSSKSHFSVALERYTDAAGSSATRTMEFDLCPLCQTAVLSKIFHEHDWDGNANKFVLKYVPNAVMMD